MSTITPVYSTTISNLKSRISELIHHPVHIARAKLEHLSEISGGAITSIDPTSPWAFQIEASSVAVAAAVDEMNIAMRRLYPKLAQTESDLYKHMSDVDYVGRFAAPATCDFYVAVSMTDIRSKMHEYVDGDYTYRDFIIPKSSFIKVGGYSFTFEYSVFIRTIHLSSGGDLYNGDIGIKQMLSVFYDASVDSPLQNLSTNFIDYEVRIDEQGEQWVYFKVPLLQTQITSETDVIHASSLFQKVITHPDKFHHLRAFYKNTLTGNTWREFSVTHSDDVFDSSIPTVTVRKLNGQVEVTLPLVYSSAGITGDILIMVYSTKGALTMDMSSYLINDYVCNIQDVFQTYSNTSSNNYKAMVAMSKSNYYTFSIHKFNGGSNDVDLNTLRLSVIYDTLGDRKLPITNVQLSNNQITREGFELIKNIDVITNRAYLAVRKLPQPSQSNILTAANFGIAPAFFQIQNTSDYEGVFASNVERVTLKSGTMFNDDNGIITIVKQSDFDSLIAGKTLQEQAFIINQKQYMYNPFYYVLDASGEEFSSRAYSLDFPTMGISSYDNSDLRFGINAATERYTIDHDIARGGYVLKFYTVSSSGYKSLVNSALESAPRDAEGEVIDPVSAFDEYVQFQIALFYPDLNSWVYYKGKPVFTEDDTDDADEFYFEIFIKTNYDIDDTNRICITNASLNYPEGAEKAFVDLSSRIRIIHAIKKPAINITSVIEDKISRVLTPSTLVPISMQTVEITFGHYLKNLWSRSRSFKTDAIYKRHQYDVYLTYTEDVYEENNLGKVYTIAQDGTITYNKLHSKGEQILAGGEPVILYKTGDIVLDANGDPVLVDEPIRSTIGLDRELDLLFVDGKYKLATTETAIAYRKEIVTTMVEWITSNVQRLQDVLLDQSRIYFYPKTTLAKISAWIDESKDTVIDAEQSLRVDLYVTSRIYNSEELRQELTRTTILTIDKFIDKSYVSVSDIMVTLKSSYTDEIKGLKLYGLGGSDDYQVLYLKDDYNRMCLKKKMVARADGTLDVSEDITITFFNVDRLISLT